MRHVRMLGVCLVAVLALGAYVVSSASAGSPEWGKCEAKVGGKYKDANCQEKAKKGEGAYEWKKGASLPNVPFTGAGQGGGGILWGDVLECQGPGASNYPGELEEVPPSRKKCTEVGGETVLNGAIAIECEKENAIGEQSGKNGVSNVKVTFKGCQLFGNACTSAGSTEGEIRTNALKGELGVITKSPKQAGVVLEPAVKHAPFATFACVHGLQHYRVGSGNKKEGAYWEPENKGGDDQVISPITPINEMTSKFTQVYSVSEAEIIEQIPDHFEGKARSSLEVQSNVYNNEKLFLQTMWSAAGEEITNVNTAAEPGEIKY